MKKEVGLDLSREFIEQDLDSLLFFISREEGRSDVSGSEGAILCSSNSKHFLQLMHSVTIKIETSIFRTGISGLVSWKRWYTFLRAVVSAVS